MRNTSSSITLTGELISLASGRFGALVTCSGTYRVGSSGKPDAAAIRLETERLLSQTSAEAVLLDYSELDYRWGDDIWHTLQPEDPRDAERLIPVAVVAGMKSQEAIKSLLELDGGFASWLDSGFVFFSVADAARYLAQRLAVT